MDDRTDTAETDALHRAVATLRARFPDAVVTIAPTGQACTDSEWAADVTVTLPDGRELRHEGGSWVHTGAYDDGLLDDHYELFDAVVAAADVAVGAAMTAAAHRAARELTAALAT